MDYHETKLPCAFSVPRSTKSFAEGKGNFNGRFDFQTPRRMMTSSFWSVKGTDCKWESIQEMKPSERLLTFRENDLQLMYH